MWAKIINKSNFFILLTFFGLIVFEFFLYKIYIPRISEFGCFDDCSNFISGYFITQGNRLYSEIFFNHAPSMPYISAALQTITQPINLYELILRHRQFLLFFGFAFNLLLLIRFKFKMIGVILIYELSKFYFFGDRFLAEAFIVYPTMYLAAISFYSITKKKILPFDILLSAFFSYFIIFSREPYVPLALFLFGIILFFSKVDKKIKILSIFLFAILSLATIFYHDVSSFFLNVITLNKIILTMENSSTNIAGVGILSSFFYPVLVLFAGVSSITKLILTVVCSVFLLETALLLKKKRYRTVLFVWITLFLANLRPNPVGQQFYESFHMLAWFSLLLFFTFCILWDLKIKKLFWYIMLGLSLSPLVFLLNPRQTYIFEKINTQDSFITNYGIPLHVGNVVSTLSKPKDTLFLDGFDDIIYWVAQRKSDYRYSWYTSLMPSYPPYVRAKLEMFQKNPPDFYYGTCIENERKERTLPAFVKNKYIQLLDSNKPSCLWVKRSKLSTITDAQWKKANEQYYFLPEENTLSQPSL